MSTLIVSAIVLLGAGAFAIVQAVSGQFLPHDAKFLGMTAEELCQLQACRILHFMIHDRISFGGVLIGIGVMYLFLASVLRRRQEAWAWWALAASGGTGFASFLGYLAYGYLDTWHGAATVSLLPLFAGGLLRTRPLRRHAAAPRAIEIRSAPGLGHALLLLSSVGISVAGLTIMTVGMTSVFVPQDLEFIGMSRAAIGDINPRLIPLIAHDRAGFGGALVSFGVAMFACVRYARLSSTLRRALAIAGVAGFATAVGVHPAIGYVSLVHLAPAVFAALLFAVGLALTLDRSLSSRPSGAAARIAASDARHRETLGCHRTDQMRAGLRHGSRT